jgi:parvulin-like peptidyl-prolyl isomerase
MNDHSMSNFSRPRALSAAAALCSLALVALAGGCGSRSDVLAVVGPRIVTVSDFQEVARGNWQQYPGEADVARRTLLEDLVRRDLLLAAADAQGLFRDSMVVAAARRAEEAALAQTLQQRMVLNAVPVSDGEIATLHGWMATQSHLQLIFAPDRSAASSAMNDLAAGADFAAVSARYTPGGLLPPGGDVGWITPGTLVPSLDNQLREAPIGAIRGPIEAPGDGWFILRVVERRPAPQHPPLEVMRSQLASMLRQRKVSSQSMRMVHDLRAAYRVRIEPDGAQIMFQAARLQNDPDPAQRRDPSPIERARVLARYDDEHGDTRIFTLGNALDDLLDRSVQPPNATSTPALHEWIASRVIARVSIAEARRRGIDREPAVRRQVEEGINNLVLDQIYTRLVTTGYQVSEADARAVYAMHAGQYQRLDAVHIARVLLPDSASAAALGQHAMHVGTLREAANMAGVTAPVEEETIHYPTENPRWKTYDAMFMSMVPGQWSAPLRTDSGWIVLQLLDKQQFEQSFDKLPPAVRKHLEEEALARIRDAKLVAVTDSLRRTVKPLEIHPERLSHIPWPLPESPGE